MRTPEDRAADRAAASPETHGLAQNGLRDSIRRLATGEHSIPVAQMAAQVQRDAEIAADFDPKGGQR